MTEKAKGGLKALFSLVEKKFGKGTLMSLEHDAHTRTDVFSTGSIGLDIALGTNGLPFGRVVEVFGPESSGKTTLALHAIASVQKLGKQALFIDAEHALDSQYAQQLGVDLQNLIISQPSSGEEALDIAEMVARSGEVGLIVIDSVAALTPRAELEGEMGDNHMGLQARLMGQALRKLTSAAYQSNTCLLFINQLRQKIGVTFGSNETTPGGNALKFYASVRLDIRRISSLKDSDNQTHGSRTRVKVVKNKLAPPFKGTEFDILFGQGICQAGEVIDLGMALNLLERSGSWFSYRSTRLGQGRDKAKQTLKDTPDLFASLKQQITQHAHLTSEAVAQTAAFDGAEDAA